MTSMIKNLAQAVSFIALSMILAGCGAAKYQAGSLQVSVENESQSTVRDIQVIHDGIMSSAGSLSPGETLEASFVIREETPVLLNFSDPSEGAINREIRVPARPQDGGELNLLIDDNGVVTAVSRFDLY